MGETAQFAHTPETIHDWFWNAVPPERRHMGRHDHHVTDVTLDNGLQVLLREDHAAPLASFWIFYRVGSRNELPGLTGISHWVEHMQFKGTPTLAKGQIFRDVSRNGGTLNALTSNDWTGYYETLPADRLGLSLAIESDRMANSLYDPEETESERTVILSERQGGRNNPGYLLYEEVLGSAFRAHPYGHMVIGHESDLKTITRDDLYNHYRRFYIPNNAFIVAVGDFESDRLLDQISERFGGIPAGPAPERVRAVEPAQLAERRVVLHHPAATSYVRVAYHAPDARHPDVPALMIADAILSGGKGMGLGGGGGMGRSSRLYRSLVSGGLARSAGSDMGLHIDPHLFQFGATVLPGGDPARVEEALHDAVRELQDSPPTDAELRKAIKQVKAQYVYSAEGVTNQAFWLGFMEIVDRYTRVAGFVDELQAVTPEAVQEAVRTWLRPESRTVGWLLPEGDGGAVDPVSPAAAWRVWGLTGPQTRARPPFERAELGNGIAVVGQAQSDDPSVSVRIRLAAGALADPEGQEGLAVMTARSLMRGTAKRSFERLNDLTDTLGASIGVDASRQWVEAGFRCLSEDLPEMLGLASEILRQPVFPEDEVEKVRKELLTGIRESEQDTRATADRGLRRLLFPAPHLLGRRTAGDLTTVPSIERSAMIEYHRRRFGPVGATIAIVGGIPDFPAAVDAIDREFGDWAAQGERAPAMPGIPAPEGGSERAALAGKSQADLALGVPTIPRSHEDFYALDLANLILGRLGLMGRLGANVRDLQGLAYHVSSSIEAGKEGSIWTSRAGVDPANVERARDSILAELRRLTTELVSEEELENAQSYQTGILPLALETNDGVAGILLTIEYYGLGLDYLDRYPGIIRSLTREDLLRAASRHLDPERVAFSMAGPPEA
jgi:zinc protease